MPFKEFIQKNSSTILTIIGAAGVVTTSVLAVKATPKALELINNKKEEKDELTTLDYIKAGWKPYIPSILSGLFSIGCIVSANTVNKKIQSSMTSAYALLYTYYEDYRKKSKEIQLPQKDGSSELNNVDQIVMRKKMKEMSTNIQLNDDEILLYFQFLSIGGRHDGYIVMYKDDIPKLEDFMNERLRREGYLTINDVYREIGVSDDELPIFGWSCGWIYPENDENYRLKIDISNSCELDTGLTCYFVDYSENPSM